MKSIELNVELIMKLIRSVWFVSCEVRRLNRVLEILSPVFICLADRSPSLSYLLCSLQTVVRCTQNTTGQTLFFFGEFYFTRVLQDTGKTSSAPMAQKKGFGGYILLFVLFEYYLYGSAALSQTIVGYFFLVPF